MKKKNDALSTLRKLIEAHRAPNERTDVNATMRVSLLTGLNVQTLAHYLSGRRKIGEISADAILSSSKLRLRTVLDSVEI